ncbi:MAG: hypothetical protein EOP46_06010 [Sphingobacteriaceae bacterium]|nr:MAG: hypothetical protein EOP46_06010 [Sphingobacteriaceae bacterium]
MNKLFLIILVLFCSCNESEKVVVTSPAKKYLLVADLNDKKEDKKNYGCVFLKLYNKHGNVLDSLQTKASVFQSWAAGWHNINDTIILCSSDIGTYAYGINAKGKLNKISVTLENPFVAIGDTIFKRKYGYMLGSD